ncbi:hypothetical protein Tco_0483630 [Tanacetum coccineum]
MRTRSSSNLIVESSTIPKRRNRRRSKQIVKLELHTIVETPVATMADTRTMVGIAQAPPKGYGDAFVIPAILRNLSLGKFGANNKTPVESRKRGLRVILCGGPVSYYEGLATDSTLFNVMTHGGPTIKEVRISVLKETDNRVSNQIDKRSNVKAITTRSGVAYDGPTIPPTSYPLPKEVKRETEATKDKVQTTSSKSTARTPPVVQVPILEPKIALKPNPKPSIPYPLRLNDQKIREKANYQMLKFLQIFQRLHFDLSFADALLHIPKFTFTFKSLLSNKENLFESANTLLNENCSAVLLKKLPKKLGDPGRFLIPCDFSELVECLELADLGGSINLMPLSVWKKLSLSELTPTRMTLELENRGLRCRSSGSPHSREAFLEDDGDENLSTIPEKESDEFIKSSVEDLVPIPSDYEDTSDSDSECDLPFCDNSVIFSNPLFDSNDDFTSSDDESLTEKTDENPLFNEVLEDIESEDSYVSKLDELDLLLTPLSKLNEDECFDPGGAFVLEEIEACPSYSIPPGIDDDDFDPEGDILLLEKLLNDDPSSPLPLKELYFTDLKTIKSSIDTHLDFKDDYYDSKGDIIYLESLFIKDTILNLPPEVFLDRDPRSLEDEPDKDDLKNIVKVFDPGIHEKTFSPTYVRLPYEDRHYLSLTYVIQIFLPYFTYPLDSSLHLSSGSKDIIFDPDISAFHFSSLESVSYESLLFHMIASDYEDSRARGFVHRSLDLLSFACLYIGFRYPRTY